MILLHSGQILILPLIIRKRDGNLKRGIIYLHPSGRRMISSDNAPAQWAFDRALSGSKLSLEQIREHLQQGKIPFAMPQGLNQQGWKLCHIRDVGLNKRAPLPELPIERLIEHFICLILPSNHFLVTKQWSGFGEIPEVIDEVRIFEEANQVTPIGQREIFLPARGH